MPDPSRCLASSCRGGTRRPLDVATSPHCSRGRSPRTSLTLPGDFGLSPLEGAQRHSAPAWRRRSGRTVAPRGRGRGRRPVPRSPRPLCTRPRRNGTRPRRNGTRPRRNGTRPRRNGTRPRRNGTRRGAPRFGPRWGQEPKAVAIARASADLPHRQPPEKGEEREHGAGPQRPDDGTRHEQDDDECGPCPRTLHRRLPRLVARPTCPGSIIAHEATRRHHLPCPDVGHGRHRTARTSPRWLSTGGRPGPIGGSGSRRPCWACRPPVPRSR